MAICGCLQGATGAAPATPPTAGGPGLAAQRDGRGWVGASGALALRVEGGVVTLAANGASVGAVESLDGGRALVVHRAGVDERWDARDGAAAQSWVFARAPAGRARPCPRRGKTARW